VGDGINASCDGNTELAMGEEVSGKVGTEMCHDDGPSETTPGGANADGTKFEGVRRVFVKREEVVGAKGDCSGLWEVACENEREDVNKSGKVGRRRRGGWIR
jgi:hypothetical protein